MLVIAAVLAGIIGVLLGLLGGGGSILTLPMLVYVAKVDPKEAIASSLFVVGTTSLVGMVAHARAGRVAYRVGALFGVAGAVLAIPVTAMLLTLLGIYRKRYALIPSLAAEQNALGRAHNDFSEEDNKKNDKSDA